MDLRIGVTHSARDIALEIESDDKSRAAVRSAVEALRDGHGRRLGHRVAELLDLGD
ncbi:MAG: DUF3107 family protein, partial [Actinobacteria bacterium]|nr:DUF3107 family protein [Actinomycetota bacterium]